MEEIGMIVVLGELGGTDEYGVVAALRSGEVTKPVVAWVTGTCAKWFKASEVQFGHAGAKSGGGADESAEAKNKALREAGAVVPESYEGMAGEIQNVYERLVREGKMSVPKEVEARPLPQDVGSAIKTGKVRKATNIVCSISDDRGEEPAYCGVSLKKEGWRERGREGEGQSVFYPSLLSFSPGRFDGFSKSLTLFDCLFMFVCVFVYLFVPS